MFKLIESPTKADIEKVKVYLRNCNCDKQWFDPAEHPQGYYLTLQLTGRCDMHMDSFRSLTPLQQFMILTRTWYKDET